MDDIKLTLIIILVIGIVAAVFLFVYLKNKEIKDDELAEYCNNKGYSFNRTKDPALSTLNVEGDNFSLISIMKPLRNPALEEATYELNTKWSMKKTSGKEPAFALGSIPGNERWDMLPDLVKRMAIQKLAEESGLTLDPVKAQVVETTGKSTFLLFEESSGSSFEAVQRLRPFLSRWSPKQIIFIKSSPDEVSLNIANCYIKDADSLNKVLELAEAITQ